MSLYRLYKIQDLVSPDKVDSYKSMKKKIKDRTLPYGYGKMDYRPAHAHVPSEKALELIGKLDKGESIKEDVKDMHHDDFWAIQEKLNPTIGYKLYFLSVSMDAGWFRTSAVKSFSVEENGDVVVITNNSVYLAELATDYE